MSSASSRSMAVRARIKRSLSWWSPRTGLLLLAAAAAIGYFWFRMSPQRGPISATTASIDVDEHTTSHGGTVIRLSVEEATAAGIDVARVQRLPFTNSTWVTGKVVLNEDRVAHIFPLVEGRVDEVNIRFGDDVKQGQLLATVQSKEVGQAKLQLVQDRLALEFAQRRYNWSREINDNTQELIAAIEARTSMDDIEEQFRDRPMGDFREMLLTAYANLFRSQTDFQRLESLIGTGVTPGTQLTAARAARDADHARLQALLEQVKFNAQQAAVEAEQNLKEASTRVLADETYLQILGYQSSDLVEIDPQQHGEALAHYPIVAPFDGTVIVKDIVLLERVSPDRQILKVADLSSVWVKADVYEQHLPRLHALKGRTLRVRSKVWDKRDFTATVFFTGETVDEQSRTLGMTARAENQDRALKPGMFVEVELPGTDEGSVLVVPRAAIQEHEGKAFVFIETDQGDYRPQDIVLGRRQNDLMEVLDGLGEGDRVVTKGGFVLKSRMLSDLLSAD